jgi:CubicO group peptidase (beta-lactamase class C family)
MLILRALTLLALLALPLTPATTRTTADTSAEILRHGEAFIAMMNSDDREAHRAFAREHLATPVGKGDKSQSVIDSLRREFDKHGKVVASRLQIVSGGKVLYAYVKREKSGVWQNYQFRCNRDDGYRLTPVFISMAVEPVERPRTPIDAPATVEWLDRFIATIDEQQPFNGLVLIQKNGKDVYSHTRGLADAERRSPITRNSRLNTASGSKMFTAVAILQLEHAGKLSLDDTVARHLPNFPNAHWAAKVTIRQLLTHTGGAGDYWDDEYSRTCGSITDLNGFTPHVLRHIGQTRIGEYSYSNSGFIVLGLIVEAVSKGSFYDCVDEHIFKPAKMADTGYPLRSARQPNIAVPYLPTFEAGAVRRGALNPAPLVGRGSSAGGASTTVDDMAKFMRAISNGTLVTLEQFKLMTSPLVPMGGTGTDSFYGLGTIISTKAGVRSFGHGGTAPGTQFECRYYPEARVLVIVMSNLDTVAGHEITSAIDDIARAAK